MRSGGNPKTTSIQAFPVKAETLAEETVRLAKTREIARNEKAANKYQQHQIAEEKKRAEIELQEFQQKKLAIDGLDNSIKRTEYAISAVHTLYQNLFIKILGNSSTTDPTEFYRLKQRVQSERNAYKEINTTLPTANLQHEIATIQGSIESINNAIEMYNSIFVKLEQLVKFASKDPEIIALCKKIETDKLPDNILEIIKNLWSKIKASQFMEVDYMAAHVRGFTEHHEMLALLALSLQEKKAREEKQKRHVAATPEHSNKSAETQTLSSEDQSLSASSPVSTSTQTASSTGKNNRKNYRRTPSLHTRLLSNHTRALSLHTNALLHHAKVLSLYNTRKIKIKKRALPAQSDRSLVQSFDFSGVQREEATARTTVDSERQAFLDQAALLNVMMLDHYRRMQEQRDEIARERRRVEDEADRREADIRDYHQRMLLELDERRREIEEDLRALEESRRNQRRPATQEIQTATDPELATTGTQATLMADAASSTTETNADPSQKNERSLATDQTKFDAVWSEETASREAIQENEVNFFKLLEAYKKRIESDEQAISDTQKQKKAMTATAHASIATPPEEEADRRQAIINEQNTAREKIMKIMSIQGKSYFDDYAEEECKQKIAQDTITKHKSLSAHPEESPTRTRTPETKHFLQYKGNPETDVDYKKTVKKETEGDTKPAEIESATTFHFTQKKNETESTEVKLIREAKPFDPQKKSREVLWRVEGKTNRTLAEQYEDIAQQSISFNVAEHLMLKEEISSLEKDQKNDSRLSELKELQKNAKPREIAIIIPGQREKDRKSYQSDDFNDLRNTINIPSRAVRLTPKEFLALKAHLNYFDVVTCNGVKFSTKARHAFFTENLHQIDSIQTPRLPSGLDDID